VLRAGQLVTVAAHDVTVIKSVEYTVDSAMTPAAAARMAIAERILTVV